jgi:hypothetical protein
MACSAPSQDRRSLSARRRERQVDTLPFKAALFGPKVSALVRKLTLSWPNVTVLPIFALNRVTRVNPATIAEANRRLVDCGRLGAAPGAWMATGEIASEGRACFDTSW